MDMNCQQICKIWRKKLNRSKNIPKSFRGGGYFFKHPVLSYSTGGNFGWCWARRQCL